jgi:tetratricopeptide (TPR) repeat protein
MDTDSDFEDYREQLLYLLQNGLYGSAETVCCFGLSSVRNKKRRAALLEIMADSLFAMSQFKRAGNYFQQAFSNLKESSGPSDVSSVDNKEESRLIFKHAMCFVELKDPSGAIKLLEKIPAQFRNVRINMTMGRIYSEIGLKRHAIGCFRHVLTLLPSAVEALEALIQLGVESAELLDLLRMSVSNGGSGRVLVASWLPKLTAALEHRFRWRIPG